MNAITIELLVCTNQDLYCLYEPVCISLYIVVAFFCHLYPSNSIVRKYTHIYIHIYIHIYTYIYIYMYIYMCVCVCTYVLYIYIYIIYSVGVKAQIG